MKFANSKSLYKITLILISLCILTNSTLLRKSLSENSNSNSNQIIEGSNSNQPGAKAVDAVTYGIKTDEKSNVQDPFKMHMTTRKPQIVDKLTKSSIAMDKVSAEAEVYGETAVTSGSYYDGTSNMRANNEECKIYSARPQECLTNSHCGWCDDIKQCVKGNRNGPMGNMCKKENFKYFLPGKDWDPLGTKRVLPNTEDSLDNNVTYHK
jgi:hypothetical protein